MTNHTVRVARATNPRPQDPSICLEFYSGGEFVEARCFFPDERVLIGNRITEWITTGYLKEKN